MIIHEGLRITLEIPECGEVVVQEYLGGGGFGDVWKVQGENNSYALKHIRLKTKDPAELVKLSTKISNEASIRIDSPYIVKAWGLKKLSDLDFVILFEYVDGQTLDEWNGKNIGVSWAVKKNLFLKILKGVSAAHQQGIIHKDLKPQNILVLADNTPKICDFGLARMKDQNLTETGDLSGTFPYMAPEIFIDAKSIKQQYDVYSLGCILYALVRGKSYYEIGGFDSPPIIKMVRNNELSRGNILDFDPAFTHHSLSVRKGIKEATIFNPDFRLGSVNEFIEILLSEEKLLTKLPVSQEVAESLALVLGIVLGALAQISNFLPFAIFSLLLFGAPFIGFALSKQFGSKWGLKLLLYYVIFHGISFGSYYLDNQSISDFVFYTNFWTGLLLAGVNIVYKVFKWLSTDG